MQWAPLIALTVQICYPKEPLSSSKQGDGELRLLTLKNVEKWLYKK